ncbi:zinc zz type domain-containing protein [Cyclospora cayetanensis]|uniref:Zinc zz type domain-containing protein n=1 Tax=Cyclospora cayetanensis TaxID=88456 RepID=A0A1D3CRD1_9EIME|nr:zinc zz type domain-containing protein [Cyclospora cayetanensis]
MSVCPLCRTPFDCLPPVCRPLYLYILKKHPQAASRRERELHVLERGRSLRSPPHHVIAEGPPGATTDELPLSTPALLLLLEREAPDLLPLHRSVELRVVVAAYRAEQLALSLRASTPYRAANDAGSSRRAGRDGSPAGASQVDEDGAASDFDEGPLRVGRVSRRYPPPPDLRRNLGDTPAEQMDAEDEELAGLTARALEGRAAPVPSMFVPSLWQQQQQRLLRQVEVHSGESRGPEWGSSGGIETTVQPSFSDLPARGAVSSDSVERTGVTEPPSSVETTQETDEVTAELALMVLMREKSTPHGVPRMMRLSLPCL